MVSVELYSCSGGMAEGFRRAGLTFDWVFDYDKDAVDSYEKNLGHRPVQMDVHDLLRLVKGGWSPGGQLDLLVADPPCSPWSRAGKRKGTEDARDMLPETCEIIRLLRPRAYLIGNVPGLQDQSSWVVVQEYIGGLSKFGYCTRDYAQLDAANYGVPQHRIRPFWYGHLAGPCIRWPARTHCDPIELVTGALFGDALKPWVTCRDALCHLPPAELGRPVSVRWREENPQGQHDVNKPARTITAARRGAGDLLGNNKHPHSTLDQPAFTLRGSDGTAGGKILEVGELVRSPGGDGHPLLEPDKPAPTIRGGGSGHSAPQNVLIANAKHPVNTLDEPSKTICTRDVGAQGGRVLKLPPQPYRVSDPDKPSPTILNDTDRATGNNPKVAWPWDRPATTIQCDDRLAPPGHHPEEGAILTPVANKGTRKRKSNKGPQSARIGEPDRPSVTLDARASRVGCGANTTLAWPWNRPSTVVCSAIDKISPANEHAGQFGPNAIVLSQRAATILQGFPEDWLFSGATKKSRWSQLGMAMPPPLAEAVARSVLAQMMGAALEDVTQMEARP